MVLRHISEWLSFRINNGSDQVVIVEIYLSHWLIYVSTTMMSGIITPQCRLLSPGRFERSSILERK